MLFFAFDKFEKNIMLFQKSWELVFDYIYIGENTWGTAHIKGQDADQPELLFHYKQSLLPFFILPSVITVSTAEAYLRIDFFLDAFCHCPTNQEGRISFLWMVNEDLQDVYHYRGI